MKPSGQGLAYLLGSNRLVLLLAVSLAMTMAIGSAPADAARPMVTGGNVVFTADCDVSTAVGTQNNVQLPANGKRIHSIQVILIGTGVGVGVARGETFDISGDQPPYNGASIRPTLDSGETGTELGDGQVTFKVEARDRHGLTIYLGVTTVNTTAGIGCPQVEQALDWSRP